MPLSVEERRRRERGYSKKYYEKHKEAVKAYRKAYYYRNKEKESDYQRQWYDKNRGHANALNAKRNTAKRYRLPIWLTKENLKQIKVMYKFASHLSKTTGFKWHVDHIIPLQGKTVSGLHVPENLQIIEESMNIKKNNKFEGIDE
jgi:5-methylcytosine-specific restriction endonuclease McrA